MINDKINTRVLITIRKDEKEIFFNHAEREGRSFSEWARLACLDRAGLVVVRGGRETIIPVNFNKND